MITIKAKIVFENEEDIYSLKSLMCKYSSCMHTIYQLYTKEEKPNEKELQKRL